MASGIWSLILILVKAIISYLSSSSRAARKVQVSEERLIFSDFSNALEAKIRAMNYGKTTNASSESATDTIAFGNGASDDANGLYRDDGFKRD